MISSLKIIITGDIWKGWLGVLISLVCVLWKKDNPNMLGFLSISSAYSFDFVDTYIYPFTVRLLGVHYLMYYFLKKLCWIILYNLMNIPKSYLQVLASLKSY